MTALPLAAHFERYFDVRRADDDASRREVFALRYAVYCEELGYEDPGAFPDGLERDAHDEHAVFALMRHLPTGRVAACVRLILARGRPGARFPFESVCAGRLDPTLLDLERLDRARAGEISRLAVHHDFRRRGHESRLPEGAVLAGARYPLVAMGLFLTATALAIEEGLEQAFMMTEPRLARLLATCGIRFTQVGDVIDYHGQRGPFRITRDDLETHLGEEGREWLEHLRARLR